MYETLGFVVSVSIQNDKINRVHVFMVAKSPMCKDLKLVDVLE